MKRNMFVSIISSLFVFLTVSCGISVPFMWDGTKVSISNSNHQGERSHTIEVKDPEYTLSNGYHISVMYVYALTEVDRSFSDMRYWWENFEKNTKRDTHNSFNFTFEKGNINKDKSESKDSKFCPVFMFEPKKAEGYGNEAPLYLFNQENVGFVPGTPVKFSYQWDTDILNADGTSEGVGNLIITATAEGMEPKVYTVARSNGEPFKGSYNSNDPEFEGEKNELKADSGDFAVWIMPVVYASSDNHPNQKYFLSAGSSVKMETSDIKLVSRPGNTSSGPADK